MPANYKFQEYKAALNAGALSPEAQSELFTKYPELKYNEDELNAAIDAGALSSDTQARLIDNFPEFKRGGYLDALAIAPGLALDATGDQTAGVVRQVQEVAPAMINKAYEGLVNADLGGVLPPQMRQPVEPLVTVAPEDMKIVSDVAKQAQANSRQRLQEAGIEPGTGPAYVANAASSVIQQAPIFAATALGGPLAGAAGLAAMGTGSMGSRYQAAREAGYTPQEAMAESGLYGLAEVIPEKLGMDAIFEAAKSVGGRRSLIEGVKQLLIATGISMAPEALEEGATQIAQNVIRKYRPEGPDLTEPPVASAFEGVGEAMITGALAGGALGGGINAISQMVAPTQEPQAQTAQAPDLKAFLGGLPPANEQVVAEADALMRSQPEDLEARRLELTRRNATLWAEQQPVQPEEAQAPPAVMQPGVESLSYPMQEMAPDETAALPTALEEPSEPMAPQQQREATLPEVVAGMRLTTKNEVQKVAQELGQPITNSQASEVLKQANQIRIERMMAQDTMSAEAPVAALPEVQGATKAEVMSNAAEQGVTLDREQAGQVIDNREAKQYGDLSNLDSRLDAEPESLDIKEWTQRPLIDRVNEVFADKAKVIPIGTDGNKVAVTLPNGRSLVVRRVDEINISKEELNAALKHYSPEVRLALLGEARRILIAGREVNFDGLEVIELAANYEKPGTLKHETFHMASRFYFTDHERTKLYQEYGGEEGAAKAYELGDYHDDSLLGRMKAFFSDMARSLFGYTSAANTMRAIERGEMWARAQAITDREGNVVGWETTGGKSIGPTASRLSIHNYDQWRAATVAELQKLGKSGEQIVAFLKAVDSQVTIIKGKKGAMEVLPKGSGDAGRTSARISGPIRPNNDPLYVVTLDLTSDCLRRKNYAATSLAIMQDLGRALTSDEQLAVALKFYQKGETAPCLYCFVESPRRKMSNLLYKWQQIFDGQIKADKPEDREIVEQFRKLGVTGDDVNFEAWLRTGGSQKPTDNVTIKMNGNEIRLMDYIDSKVVAQVNQLKTYEEYSGEVFEMVRAKAPLQHADEKGQTMRDYLAARAGFRIFSSSDIQPEHILDMIQACVDMQVVGMPAHAYTKIEDFVKIFGKTGIKINLSLFGKAVNGQFVPDNWQSFPYEKALEYRKSNPDIGTILVATDDATVKWGLDNPDIDYVIPYHASGFPVEVSEMAEFDWTNYTSTQKEKYINEGDYKTKGKIKIRTNDYMDPTKGSTLAESKKRYLAACKEKGVTPVFPQFVDHPNYMKLKKDYARTDTPMTTVNATKIDLKEASARMQRFITDKGEPGKVLPKIKDEMANIFRTKETNEENLTYARSKAVIAEMSKSKQDKVNSQMPILTELFSEEEPVDPATSRKASKSYDSRLSIKLADNDIYQRAKQLARAGDKELKALLENQDKATAKALKIRQDKAPDDGVAARLKRALIDEYAPILGLTNGQVTALTDAVLKERNIADIIAAHGEAYLPAIAEKMKANGLDYRTIGLWMQLNRIINERSKKLTHHELDPATGQLIDIYGVKDQLTAQEAARAMSALMAKLSPTQQLALQEIIADFNNGRQAVKDMLLKSGALPKELMAVVQNNDNYATFNVVKYMENRLGTDNALTAAIREQHGTTSDIENPFVATLLKDAALMRYAARMTLKNEVIKATGAKPATVRSFAGRHEVEQPPKATGLVGILTMSNGEPKGYLVPKAIAEVLEQAPMQDMGGLGVLMELTRSSMSAIRQLLTTRNPGFALLMNPIRDTMDAFIKMPLALKHPLLWAKHMATELAKAYSGYQDHKAINELTQRGVIMRGNQNRGEVTEDPMEYLQNKLGVDLGIEVTPAQYKGLNKLTGAISSAADFLTGWVTRVGERLENAPKLAAAKFYRELKANGQASFSEEEFNYYIDKFAGSPALRERGGAAWFYNTVFMFSNAAKQAYRTHYQAARMNGVEYLAKMAGIAAINALALAAASSTAPEWWKKISDYDKKNYFVIPMGTDENGRAVYMRLPKPETVRILSSIMYEAVNPDKQMRDKLTQGLALGADELPTPGPIFTAGLQLTQYMSGQNPYDFFRGKQVLQDRVYRAQNLSTDAAMAQHMWNSLGGSAIYRFDTTKGDGIEKSTVEQIANTSIFGLNAIGKVFKVSDAGLKQEAFRLQRQEDRENAREELLITDVIVPKVLKGQKLTPEEVKLRSKHQKFFMEQVKLEKYPAYRKKQQMQRFSKEIRPQVEKIFDNQ